MIQMQNKLELEELKSAGCTLVEMVPPTAVRIVEMQALMAWSQCQKESGLQRYRDSLCLILSYPQMLIAQHDLTGYDCPGACGQPILLQLLEGNHATTSLPVFNLIIFSYW